MKLSRSVFKKLTPFDMGVGVIIAIAGLVFFLFFNRKAEYITIQVKVTNQDVLYQNTEPAIWYANRFVVGDKERDALGKPITEILAVDTFPIDGKRNAVYLKLRVRAVYDTRTKLYSTHGQNIMFGTPVRFSLANVTFDGFVTEFPGSEKNHMVKIGKAKVVSLARYLEPAVAQAIQPGDKIINSDHVVLAEIVDVMIKPAERVTTNYAGDLLLRPDPIFKDAVITAEMRTKTIGNETFIFDNMPLKIGQFFPLILNNVMLDRNTPPTLNDLPLITSFILENP